MSKARLIAVAGSGVVHGVVAAALLLGLDRQQGGVGRGVVVSSIEVVLVRGERPGRAAEANPSRVDLPARSAAAVERQAAIAAIPSQPSPHAAGAKAEEMGATPNVSAPADGASFSDYQRVLRAHISAHQFYPDAGRARRLVGVVDVGFVVERDGKVAQIWIETSSGSRELDEAALETVRRAQPLPVIPVLLPDPMSVTLPVSFSAPQRLSQN